MYAYDTCFDALEPTAYTMYAFKSGNSNVHWYNVKDNAFGFSPNHIITLNEGDICDESCLANED